MMTWEECAAAGMSKSEAARHRGVNTTTAGAVAKTRGLVFRNGRYDNGANLSRDTTRTAATFSRRLRSKLTPAELACYRALRQGSDRLPINEALRLIGRADLIEVKE